LIHFTRQGYLSAHPGISRPHSAIAEICLTYLISEQVKSIWTVPSLNTQNTPFLEYCFVYWRAHEKRELSGPGRLLALEILKEPYGQIPTKLLFAQAKHMYLGHLDTDHPFSGLHCESFFGIVEVVAGLIELEYYDVNGKEFWGRTPLAWGAYNGNEGVVEVLLGWEEVNPDMPDKFGRTPLLHAAECAYEGAIKMVLGREEVNPERADNYGQTRLGTDMRDW